MTQSRNMDALGNAALPPAGRTAAAPAPEERATAAMSSSAPASTAGRSAKTPASETRKVDFCILGSGVAARLVAVKAAEAGASALLVAPPDAPAGLPGLLSAPLALIEAANLAHASRIVDALRLRDDDTTPAAETRLSGEGLVRHLHLVGEALAGRTADARLLALQVSILTEPAAFEDARALRVGDRRVVARRFVLAPDLEWDLPLIPGINEIDYLTPDRPLVGSRPIGRLVVIGLSDTGLALAQAHRRLGASVTLLPSPHDDPRRLDDEILRLALMGLGHDGVAVRLDATVTRIEARGREAVVHGVDGSGPLFLDPAQVLLAPRLRTRFTDPDWTAAQITLDGEAPALDAAFYTSNRRVQAIGADVGRDMFSFRLERDADFIVDSVLHRRMPVKVVPIRAIPTTPEIAIVGLDESAARRVHGRISIVRTPYAHHLSRLARHRGLGAPAGELKIIASRDRRIVGCAIAGDSAMEIAGLWSLAISRRLKLDDVGGLAFPDIARHSLTRRATRLAVFGWPLAGSLLLRLARLWRKIRG
ncbi:FAD-dependent oxidoreductase [Pseudochelatococcus sp. B33]